MREVNTIRVIHADRVGCRASQLCSLNLEQLERARSAGCVNDAHDNCFFCLNHSVFHGSDTRGSSVEYLPRVS